MALLKILTEPNPLLHQVAEPVQVFDSSLCTLLDDMLATMYNAPGCGLAATQVGILKRVLVLDIADADALPQPMRIINPEITWVSDHDQTYEEGCLSIPDHYLGVTRPAEVKVRYQDPTGLFHDIHATGFLAICLQHEIDHLNGILMLDHVSTLKKNMILRKLLKQKRHPPAPAPTPR